MDTFKPKHVTRNLHDEMTSDQIFDMDVRYNAKRARTKKEDPPYRGKGYHDVLGSLATYKDVGEHPATNAGRKANTYRANRSKFNGHSVLLNGFNDDSGAKAETPAGPIRLNRSRRWKSADNYVVAREASPSHLKVH